MNEHRWKEYTKHMRYYLIRFETLGTAPNVNTYELVILHLIHLYAVNKQNIVS